MDLIGPMPVTPRGNKYVITLTDYFSKWAEAAPLPDKSALGVAKFINPRRACAARVTVVVLCVCVSACVCVSTTILGLQATRRLMSDTNRFSATRAGKIMWRFC